LSPSCLLSILLSFLVYSFLALFFIRSQMHLELFILMYSKEWVSFDYVSHVAIKLFQSCALEMSTVLWSGLF
jgi:hypothetical protein